jgi:hypothetical protein
MFTIANITGIVHQLLWKHGRPNKRAIFTCLGLGIGGLILLGPTACDDHSASNESSVTTTDGNGDAAQIDQRLVGRWRHTDAYVSGDFSAAIDLWFILKADGAYESFKGSVAAGNSDTSLVNGGHGDVAKGKWRTESKILYTAAESSDDWQRQGTYFVDEGRFMVNKVVWERQ